METAPEIEFDHFERILAGVGTRLKMRQTRAGRTARAMLEARVAEQYDRAGCFCYAGWKVTNDRPAPPVEEQLRIYAAFANSAVAAGVYLGALEPNEGFGLADWNPSDEPSAGWDHATAVEKMTGMLARAGTLLAGRMPSEEFAPMRVALGFGRLRGKALLWPPQQSDQPKILAGHGVVQTIYGEIPNRCGALAKGKDVEGEALLAGKSVNFPGHYIRYRQPWTRMEFRTGTSSGTRPMVPGPILDTLIEDQAVPAAVIDPAEPQIFLVGFSLDFAQSRREYQVNANLARTIVNRILSEWEELATRDDGISGMFISPRYGDGVAAVIVVEADTPTAVRQRPWFIKLADFCKSATHWLQHADQLGLRIGMAIEPDSEAAAPRLAGLGRTASPAIERLAEKVIGRARDCHGLAKKKGLLAVYETRWFCHTSPTDLEKLA